MANIKQLIALILSVKSIAKEQTTQSINVQ